MSNFKLIFIAVFIGAAVLGVLVFSGIITIGGSGDAGKIAGKVTIWGTFDQGDMAEYVEQFNLVNRDINIDYVQQDAAKFDALLVEAIATGAAPDLVLLPDTLIWRFQDKLTTIPFTSLPAQTFQATFTSGSNIFAVPDGAIAVPWASDPLVMYYNRDMLETAGMAQPPKTWQEFASAVPLFVRKTSDLTLTQMATALGTYRNIAHAKDILALLSMESGSPFITSNGDRLAIHFGPTAGEGEQAAVTQAVEFFMSFSDPLKEVYSWNAGFPSDRDAFIQSSLAFYFGTASELPLIRQQNPNLNFGIALPPQAPTGPAITTGHLYGFAIPKSASNPLLSFTATTLLSGQQFQTNIVTELATKLSLIPVRRDILAQDPVKDPYLGFLFDAALVQRAWIDPNPIASDQIFSNLIRDITASALSAENALIRAAAQLQTLNARI